jgi:hypothetical protein
MHDSLPPRPRSQHAHHVSLTSSIQHPARLLPPPHWTVLRNKLGLRYDSFKHTSAGKQNQERTQVDLLNTELLIGSRLIFETHSGPAHSVPSVGWPDLNPPLLLELPGAALAPDLARHVESCKSKRRKGAAEGLAQVVWAGPRALRHGSGEHQRGGPLRTGSAAQRAESRAS